MAQPIIHNPTEGGKTLLNTKKQDVMFGVGINAGPNILSTAPTRRISNSATMKSTNKGKDKSGQGVTLKTIGSTTRTPSGSSNTNRNKLPGDSGPNKSGKSGEYKRRSPEDNDKKSSKAAGIPQRLTAYIKPKDRKSSEAAKRASSTRGTDITSTHGIHTGNHNNDKRSTKAGGMTPESTMSTKPDVPFVNGKTVHTEVASVKNEKDKQENGSIVVRKKSILKKLCDKRSPTSDKGRDDAIDDDFDFDFRADGRMFAGDVQKADSHHPSGFVEKEDLNSGKLKDGNISGGTQNATASGENKTSNDSKSNVLGTSQNGAPNVDISHDRDS